MGQRFDYNVKLNRKSISAMDIEAFSDENAFFCRFVALLLFLLCYSKVKHEIMRPEK